MLLSSAFLQTNLYVEEPTAFTIGLQMESMLSHHFLPVETPETPDVIIPVITPLPEGEGEGPEEKDESTKTE